MGFNCERHASQFGFPGAPVYRLTQTVAGAIKKVNEYIYDVTIHKARLTDYNVRHHVSNPVRVDEGLEHLSNVQYILHSALRSSAKALNEITQSMNGSSRTFILTFSR